MGLWPRGAEYYSRTEWAGRIKLGKSWVLDSPISNAFAHHLSLALFFSGAALDASAAPTRVAAELYRAQRIENFDTAALRIETDTGVSIHFYASHSCTSNIDPELVIEGLGGRVTWRHGDRYTVERDQSAPREVILGDEQSARLHMFRNTLARLRDDSIFVCGTAIAREHTRCIQAAQRTGPVHDVPAEWVKTNGAAGTASQTWIVGIEETLRQAFERAQTLGEAGCPWAATSVDISISAFDRAPPASDTPAQAT